VDFLTPIVDDPEAFGRIAVANALSDVYAMGGTPRTALNLVAFPLKRMPMEILRRILIGGLEKMREAGVLLVGGHSIEDEELKYGLSVTGVVHPDRILAKAGIREGDALVLTKPLGTGVLSTAVKAGLAAPEAVQVMTASMRALNRAAAEVAAGEPVSACTDVTGFGLIGHLAEMVCGTAMGVEIEAHAVPLLQGALEAAGMGLLPAGAHNNRKFREGMVRVEAGVDPLRLDLLHDPQTSGGLLFAVPAERAARILPRLAAAGVAGVLIGRAAPGLPGAIRVVP